ncbi:MAG TPA: YcnI family protein [Pseudonocardia sp.]|nr:YcnI family protein [Pseudonocardia sp.]
MSRPLRRPAAVLAVSAALVLAGAAPALAHVTAQPGEARQGGYTVVNLRVPNESDTAGTIELEVTLPADHPITGVRTTPVPGWTVTTTRAPLDPPIERHGRTITETVRTVTWTATPGTRIGPDEFLEFPLSLGPLPTDTDRILLPAVQTYDDGRVVAWDQPPAADEPERPAPVLNLLPAEEGDGHVTAAGTGTAGTDAPAADAAAAGTDTTARWLGGSGLLLGGLGLGLGAGAALRGRRRPA